MKIKPAEGRRVLDPVTKKPLPEAGASVRSSSYWERRLKAGDVVLISEADSESREE